MRFTKLQGAGNDYIFVDGLNEERDWPEIARRVADRHFGVGADGLIVVTSSSSADIRMRMFNADGSEGEMCGNGIRCFAKFVLERELIEDSSRLLRIETGAGVLTVAPYWDHGKVIGAQVNMGPPTLNGQDVPVDASKIGPSDYGALDRGLVESLGLRPEDLIFDAAIVVDGVSFAVTGVSMGNPHAVAFVDEPIADIDLGRLGPLMEQHEAYPNRMNFHIVNIEDRDRLISRTWERGSGLTLACGTGASAMVVAARLHGTVDSEVNVEVPGGELHITWPGYGAVLMDGDAVEVFNGDIRI